MMGYREPKNLIRKCTICGKEFAAKNANQWYCSQECRKEGERTKARQGTVKKVHRGMFYDVTEREKPKTNNMEKIAEMVKHDPFYGKHQAEEYRSKK